LFSGQTGPTFDPVTPAAAAAGMTISLLLQHERAARLIDYHAKDNKYPGLIDVIDKLLVNSWYRKRPSVPYQNELLRVVEEAVVRELMKLADNQQAAYRVRAVASSKLDEILAWINNEFEFTVGLQRAHFLHTANTIERFINRPFNPERELIRPVLPPGSPIGIK